MYCAADNAHICWSCDAKVHGANFLVARHTRSVLCKTCGISTTRRTTGANPTPLTGLCSGCLQGEVQGECTTYCNRSVVSSRRAASRSCLAVAGRSDSGSESGCSLHVPNSSRDMECVIVDRSAQESVSSASSQSLKRKRSLDCRAAASNPQAEQVVTRTLEDVHSRVAQLQCECTSATSSAINRSSASHDHQDTTLETRDGNRSQPPVMGSNNGAFVTLRSASAKRLRMDDSAQTSPSLRRSQQSAALATSRLTRILAKWHWDLHLSSPDTVPLALRLFRKAYRALAPAVLSNAGTSVVLAACLLLAAGLDEAQITAPKASDLAAFAGVSTRTLCITEIHLVALLGRRRSAVWAGTRN